MVCWSDQGVEGMKCWTCVQRELSSILDTLTNEFKQWSFIEALSFHLNRLERCRLLHSREWTSGNECSEIWGSSLLRSSQSAVCHLRPVPCNKRSDSVVSSSHSLAFSQGWQIMIHCSLWHYCKRTNNSEDWISQWWKRTLYDCCESDHSKWVNRVHHSSLIHQTWLFLCDHREWLCQINSDSYHSRRIGIDICMVFLPITSMTLELTFWSHSYNTTPVHMFLVTWSAYHSITLFILHIIDIDRLVIHLILEYSFGRGISNCHWSFRDSSRFVFALLGWHSHTWYLPFNPLLLIGMNGVCYRQNRHRWIGMNGDMYV